MTLKNTVLIGLWLMFGLLARLIPHAPNLSPFTSLIILIGCQLSRRTAVTITLLCLFFSDLFIAKIFNYSVFGSWSLFTYTGFAFIACASTLLQKKRSILRVIAVAASSVLGYWVWTNFGTWVATIDYPHTLAGLGMCFMAGLPFLANSVQSTLFFVPVFFAGLTLVEHYMKSEKQVVKQST